MTDYGRSPGSEPWHSEDPLFGDQWDGNQQQHQQPQYQQQQGGWDPYATGQQPQYDQQGYQQQPQQPQQPQQQYDTWGGAPAAYGGNPGDPYGDPYANGGQQADYYGQGGYPPPQPPQYQGQQPQHPQQPQQQQHYEQQQYDQQQYDQQQQPRQQQPQQQPLRTSPPPPADWDPEAIPAEETHAFFTGGDDDDEDDDPRDGRRARGGKGKGKSKGGKKRRSGCACLVVLLVLGGGGAGATWYGYQYYQQHFGPAPDYSGSGKGEVQVEIPSGSSGNTIGNILKKAGVVKSVDAFVSATNANPKGKLIQAGVYVLRGQMSAKSAVTMMLDPSSQNVLIIPEGLRATKIYALIDAKLKLSSGTTAKAAQNNVGALGLPSYAGGNPEGFLYPARYSIGSKTTSVALLKQMVQNAKTEYTKLDLASAGKNVNLDTAYDVIIEASILQAEVDQKADMGKAARALYNRLNTNATNHKLELDSTLQYHLGKTKLTSAELASKAGGFNTYTNTGLPPAPIANPGSDAIEAVLNPTKGDWVYWVTVKSGDTRFAVTWADHLKNVKAYCEYHGQTLNTTSGSCQ
ncbi:endolytic transglycosylase MltG [Streptomyces sp. NPDC059373]